MELFGVEGQNGGADNWNLVIYPLLLLVGGAITYVVNLALKLRDSREAKQTAQEKTILEHKDELIKRLDAAVAEKDKEIKELREAAQVVENKQAACQIISTGRRRHIRYLERILAAHKLSYEEYTDDEVSDGSNVHAPLTHEQAKKT